MCICACYSLLYVTYRFKVIFMFDETFNNYYSSYQKIIQQLRLIIPNFYEVIF